MGTLGTLLDAVALIDSCGMEGAVLDADAVKGSLFEEEVQTPDPQRIPVIATGTAASTITIMTQSHLPPAVLVSGRQCLEGSTRYALTGSISASTNWRVLVPMPSDSWCCDSMLESRPFMRSISGDSHVGCLSVLLLDELLGLVVCLREEEATRLP
ncbi:expressed unknown protein [Seminavis robusta]|uniref:Uncharacterized protein n=1 Tax=Seminavis robusta TaxID=568900 RepID=A0A9N8F239_9STRA|nr:expressed unknown protein [Seminavis robusta]|eukprot:Sro3341_g119951.1  (156) ;mRNA; r:1038-1505